MRSALLCLVLGLSGIGLACPNQEPRLVPPVAGTELALLEPNGQTRLRLIKRSDGGYTLENAAKEKIGKVKIEADRVKVKDVTGALRAKVKKKSNGFKLEDGAQNVVLKGKLKDENALKLVDGDDQTIGRLVGSTGTLEERAVAVRNTEEGWVVEVEGRSHLMIRGPVSAEPAALMGLARLDDFQRAALLVYVKEVM